ncbi:97 kDa heat shock protein [Nephila pilipes]|uniref:97 kDa heat shock protein n=1 Tax=Nephila pilipes TaxID=299642 RepID=A0A8X6NXE7_NEPPI|nr:97 kDa heat shock protein [Nephila pilipes]
MSAVGFDIGNETCFIATAKYGGIDVIDNEYSLRVTPSYVGFSEKSRDVGVSAKTKLVPNIKNTVFGFKTLLGKRFDKNLKELSYLSFNVSELPSGDFGVRVKYLNEENIFSMEQLMAMMITKLKSITENKLGTNIKESVISVPVYYTDMQRRAMLDAAEIAGIKALKLINEPTAIALSYGFYRPHLFDEPKTIIFVDFGHSSLTVTACVFTKDKLKILGNVWNTNVGGRDFDGILVKHFAQEFKNRYHLDVMSSKKAIMLLMMECESLKKQMSMNSRELELSIECFMNDVDVRGKMKRELFEKLAENLFIDIETTMKDLLSKTGLNEEDIHEIQIVGGSCRIPALKDIIYEVFGQYPLATLNQDEAVARGCALQCAFLSPTVKTKNFSIEDINPYSIEVLCHRSNVEDKIEVFPVFHRTPATKMVTFSFKTPFFLEVFYSSASCNTPEIGKFTFFDVPSEVNENNDVKIKIRMSLDIHGIFNVYSASLIIKQKESNTDNSKQLVCVPDNSKYSAESSLQSNDEDVQDVSCEELTESDAKSKEIFKYFDLKIKATVPSLTRTQMDYLIQKEQEMINVDLNEKRMADLRNIVEEYVYYSRGKLSSEVKKFLPEIEWKKFLSILQDTETWLYECENPQECEYSRRLIEMKQHVEPVLQWYAQLEDAKSALQEFQKLLESFASIMRSLPQEKRPQLSNDDMTNLEELWNHGNEYFGHWLHKLKEIRKYGDLPITAESIREEMNNYQERIQSIINKPDQDEVVAGGDSSEDIHQAPGESPEDLASNQEFKEEYKSSSEKDTMGGQSSNGK